MRNLSNIFNFLAFGLIIVVFGAFVWHSNLLNETENTLDRSSRYDVSWIGAMGRLEALTFQKNLTKFALTRSAEDAQKVRVSSEILKGRFMLFQIERFQEFLVKVPSRLSSFKLAKREFESIAPLLASIESLNSDQIGKLSQTVDHIHRIIDRLGAEAHTESVNLAKEIRADLLRKQEIQRQFAGGFFIFTILLLSVAVIQNRYLRTANMRAIKSARDFAYLAHHDNLTSLPNRMAFTNKFHSVVQAYLESEQAAFAILAIDLDGFKDINDRIGHASGDELLVQVGSRLEEICHGFNNSIVASRIGGDEFVVMLKLVDGEDAIRCQAEEIQQELSRPYAIKNSSVRVGASIGVAISTRDSNPSMLLVDADMALAKVKATGKSRVVVFDPAMRDTMLRSSLIESELVEALENNDVTPYYQIKIDVGTGTVTGVEALARWIHPELGFISPAEFVEIAERSSLIVRLGQCILEQACRDALNFPDDVSVSVNLSASQFFRDDIVKTVSETLEKTGFPAERLTLEVTESLMISEAERAVNILSRFKQMGISIALDDFGTGYSALSYLRQFEWDELKIDRSFVADIESDQRACAIVRSINSMADELGIDVTAEGAENAGQVEILRQNGCKTIQGYYFGRPVPVEELPTSILNGISTAAKLNLFETMPAVEFAEETLHPLEA